MIGKPIQYLKTPVAVVCHDAGATNLIAGWLRGGASDDLRVHVQGPAEAIWREAFPEVSRVGMDEALFGAATLLSGTGWASSLEHEARLRARRLGIPIVAAIDHWVNYKERFVRAGCEVLPDEVWIADDYAQAEAARSFPGITLRQFPNRYLVEQAEEVRALDVVRQRAGGAKVLYVLEPIRLPWQGSDLRPGEFQALDYFIQKIHSLGLGEDAQIRLRPHPSDPPGKYDAWVAQQNRKFDIAIAPPQSLSEAVSWADWVVGCESFVLVIGLAAGKRTLSTLPPWGNRCRLPHDGLLHLSHLP